MNKLKDSVGRDCMSKITVKTAGTKGNSHRLFEIVLLDQVKLQALPDELFVVQGIGLYSGRREPRSRQ